MKKTCECILNQNWNGHQFEIKLNFVLFWIDKPLTFWSVRFDFVFDNKHVFVCSCAYRLRELTRRIEMSAFESVVKLWLLNFLLSQQNISRCSKNEIEPTWMILHELQHNYERRPLFLNFSNRDFFSTSITPVWSQTWNTKRWRIVRRQRNYQSKCCQTRTARKQLN